MKASFPVLLPALAALLTLSGCAADIMRTYIGSGPEAVIAHYGPPDTIFDLPDGRRGYQWLQVTQSTSAGSEETRTRIEPRGRHGGAQRVTTTQITPPSVQTSRCFYTLYAHRVGDRWVFDDFARPILGC